MSALEYILNFSWPLLWVIFALTIWDAFHDHSENRERVKLAFGKEKRRAIFKHIRSWAIPILVFIAAVIAQIGSDIDESKIAKLESQNAPRTLTPEQSARITAALIGDGSLKPMICFDVDALSEDGQQYATAIAQALANAGFIINSHASSISAGLGRDVTVSPSNSPLASAITLALTQNGVRTTIPSGSEVLMGKVFPTPPDAITIGIGKKSIESH